MSTIQGSFKARRGTAAAWASANPILAAGEGGFATDTGTFKIGNGVSTWSALAALSVAGGGGGYLPSLNNMIASTWDPALGGGAFALTSGRMHIARIALPACTVTNIHVLNAATGAVTNAYAAIYSKAGALLRQSANGAAGFSAIALQTMVLTSPLVVAADQYYLGFWYTGATPTMTVANGGSVLVNVGLAAPNLRAAWTDNALVATAPANFAAQQLYNSLWFGVS